MILAGILNLEFIRINVVEVCFKNDKILYG